ncbi:hypothetical protein I7S79_08230 [Neisseria meningitidis]|nr:hypothetical protein [Neisseria meningitidis]MBH2013536.1 hypothetical protein [Neisseria meningitidis]MBH2020882.1 hypothetical protein [Neisseria meningitidis]MBH2025727.1 hypothetical protein [Neisseria meningitidis]MBH2027705.1 hypothetical protein [Neisseria meningitidis]
MQQNTPAAGKRKQRADSKKIKRQKTESTGNFAGNAAPFQKPLPDSHFFKLENIKQINAFISPQKGL